ncbi:MAG: polysaccharide biosynthesis/export family protein [Paludibacter sp.]
MHKLLIRLLFILTLTLSFSSCITTHQTNYLQPSKDFIAAYVDTFSYKDYCLKENDRLFVQVYSIDEKTNALFNGSSGGGMQSMSGGGGSTSSGGSGDNMDLYTYAVLASGNIIFPIVGEISVKGKTIRQAKEIIENAIRPVLKVNSVDVRLVGKTFSVIGAGKSGKFTFPREKINIYQALAIAGDVSTFTDRSKIKILRVTEKGTQIRSFDIRSINIINSEFYYIEPDDVIFLQPMNQQFFGATTLWSTISTIITSASFFVGIYYLLVPKTK